MGGAPRRRRRADANDATLDPSEGKPYIPSYFTLAVQLTPPPLPAQVEYSGGFEVGNPQRFGQDFLDKVANPRDIVHFYKKKKLARESQPRQIAQEGVAY